MIFVYYFSVFFCLESCRLIFFSRLLTVPNVSTGYVLNNNITLIVAEVCSQNKHFVSEFDTFPSIPAEFWYDNNYNNNTNNQRIEIHRKTKLFPNFHVHSQHAVNVLILYPLYISMGTIFIVYNMNIFPHFRSIFIPSKCR